MPTRLELRKKYRKWAHRRDEHKKRRRKSRRKRRRSRRRSRRSAKKAAGTSTEGMLVSLLQQLMLGGTLAKKHGQNVITGYADKVKPDSLAPVRSRHLYREAADGRDHGMGHGAGAGAAAAAGYRPEVRRPPRPRSPSPRPGGYPAGWDSD